MAKTVFSKLLGPIYIFFYSEHQYIEHNKAVHA